MNTDVEFIKGIAKIKIKKYCDKYNVDYSNLVKGLIRDKEIIHQIRIDIERDLKGVIDEETIKA